MNYELRIFKNNGLWHCELWGDFEELFHCGKEFKDKVTSESYSGLQTEIGNKNWIDLLNKE